MLHTNRNYIFENCDDGQEFFFIRTESGEILDPYYDTGVFFNHQPGQNVKFGLRPADFNTPCTIAERAVYITCIEELSIFESALAPGTYNYTVCQAETITLDVRVPPGLGQTEHPCNGQGTVSGDLQNFAGFVPNEDGTLTVTIYNDASFTYSIQLAGPDNMFPCDYVWNFNFTIDPSCNSQKIEDSFPWIFDTGLIDSTNCEGVTISEYIEDGQSYIFIQTPDSEIIYSPSGMPNCVVQTDGSVECATLEEFGLTNLAVIWECPQIDAPDCARHSGTIFFEDCDDGQEFFFIRTEGDVILDPYYGEGIAFQHADNLKVNFDYIDATFDTPCSNAEKAIIITCIQEEILDATNELTDIEIKLYPNPVKRNLFIQTANPELIENISIVDQLGKNLFQSELINQVTQLDLSQIEPGIYYLVMNGEEKSRVEKFILIK